MMSAPASRTRSGLGLGKLFEAGDLAAMCLGFLPKWFGVASAKKVSKGWRELCKRVRWSSLIFVTASKLNAMFVFGEGGGLRQRIPTMPWKRASRLDPSGEKLSPSRRVDLLKVDRGRTYPLWPTCVCVGPRRLYVSQYRVCGVVVYGVNDRGHLFHERVFGDGDLAYPEGLVLVGSRLVVATCNGTIACLDAETGTIEYSISREDAVFWNAALVDGHVVISAHRPDGDDDYTSPTETDTGFLLRYHVESRKFIVLATGLNRPSGLVQLDGKLLVTTFVSGRGSNKVRKVVWCQRGGGVVDYAPVPARALPWGLAVQPAGERGRRLWVCGHGNTLLAVENDAVLFDARAHPAVDASKKYHYINHPQKAHFNVAVVV